MLPERTHLIQFRKPTTLLSINSENYGERQVKLKSLNMHPGDVCPVVIKPLFPMRDALGGFRERCHLTLLDAMVLSDTDSEPLAAGDFAREVDYNAFQFLDADDD